MRNYRACLATDSRLASLFHEERKLVEQSLLAELSETIRAANRFLRQATEQDDPTDPDMVHVVAGG